MRKLAIILICQFYIFSSYSQIPYLNEIYSEGYGEISSNLIISDSYEMVGTWNTGSNIEIFKRDVDFEGQLIQFNNLVDEDHTFFQLNLAESALKTSESSYVITGNFQSGSVIIKTDPLFNEIEWYYDYFWTPDSLYNYEWNIITECSNGDILALGSAMYDIDDDPFQDFANVLFVRLSNDGEEIVFEETNIYDDKLFRPNQIQELPNGEIIVFGAFRYFWDNIILRYTSNGILIDYYEWGSPEYNEWFAWGVYEGGNEFKVGYVTSVGTMFDNDNIPISFPSTMTYDPVTQEITNINNYPSHQLVQCAPNDMIKTPDGGYLLMGYASRTELTWHTYGWLLKTDAEGNEEWFKEYNYDVDLASNDPLNFDYFYDLELAPDSGYVIVGSHQVLNEPQHSWLLKLDACGDVEYSDCPGFGPDNISEMNSNVGQLQIYPNPSTDIANIDFPLAAMNPNYSLRILNVNGQEMVLESGARLNSKMEIDVSKWAAGLYLVQVLDDAGRILDSGKMVVE